MSAFQEVMQTVSIFVFAFIVIPVAIYTTILVSDYYRKERRWKNVGKTAGRNPKR